MGKDPTIPFFASDFLVDTIQVEERLIGAYIRILVVLWVNGKCHSDRDAMLAISPSAPEVLERLKDKFTFFPDGTFTSNRMEVERAKRIKNRELRAEAGHQGADKRWGKVCHRFANGKKMTKEYEYEKENKKDTRGGAGGETAARFATFWSLYPARRGKKIGKAEAEIAFSILSPDDQAAVLVAVKNYAASDTLPKDPVRFIRKDYWREWMEPETKAGPVDHKPATRAELEPYKERTDNVI